MGKSERVFSAEELNARAEANSHFNQRWEAESPRAALQAVCTDMPGFLGGLNVSPKTVQSGLVGTAGESFGELLQPPNQGGPRGALGSPSAAVFCGSVSHQGQMPEETALLPVGREKGQ